MINIHARVRHIIQKYGTRNPEKLSKEMGITIIRKPFKNTMGFFKKALGKKFIVVNSNLSEDLQSIVIAHELGHAILHSNNTIVYIHEYTLFPRGKIEIEANEFAAELLIDERDMDKLYIKDMSVNQLACYFGVPKQLIEYKFMKEKYRLT